MVPGVLDVVGELVFCHHLVPAHCVLIAHAPLESVSSSVTSLCSYDTAAFNFLLPHPHPSSSNLTQTETDPDIGLTAWCKTIPFSPTCTLCLQFRKGWETPQGKTRQNKAYLNNNFILSPLYCLHIFLPSTINLLSYKAVTQASVVYKDMFHITGKRHIVRCLTHSLRCQIILTLSLPNFFLTAGSLLLAVTNLCPYNTATLACTP